MVWLDAADKKRISTFLYQKVDFDESKAEQAAEDGWWQSFEQLEALWHLFYMKWDLSKQEARSKLEELSWNREAMEAISSDKKLLEGWWGFYYMDCDLSKQETGEKMMEMLVVYPNLLTRLNVKDCSAIQHALYMVGDWRKQEASKYVFKFDSAEEVKKVWRVLYNDFDLPKKKCMEIIEKVERFGDAKGAVSLDYLKKCWARHDWYKVKEERADAMLKDCLW